MPDTTHILHLFDTVTVWKRRGQRAPHKPLLLLLALAALQRGEPRLLSFEDVEGKLERLLVDFGPPRQSYHPEYPFWRLQADGDLWQIPNAPQIEAARGDRKRSGDVPKAILRQYQAAGGFSPAVYDALCREPALVNQIAARLLQAHFPASLHEAILDAVGMPWIPVTAERSSRDPAFREAILRIYEHRCAVCGFDGRLDMTDLALDAAHVMWHAAGGPDTEENGLALCVLHHRLLDRGALSLSADHRVLVSQRIHGGHQVQNSLVGFAGRALHGPQAGTPPVAAPFIRWHQQEVFRGPARVAGS